MSFKFAAPQWTSSRSGNKARLDSTVLSVLHGCKAGLSKRKGLQELGDHLVGPGLKLLHASAWWSLFLSVLYFGPELSQESRVWYSGPRFSDRGPPGITKKNATAHGNNETPSGSSKGAVLLRIMD